ncbi:hypothetical protein [Caulobacter sp.]|uniref:hypothetical protein n=1 Tax=Caulobacter sp. TaxID=78 RepID=UPI00161FAF57
MSRALIHAVVGPVVASLLLLAITFTTDLLFRMGAPGKLVAQLTEVVSNMLRPGPLLLFPFWALLAWLGMVIADARRPRTVLGRLRLATGALLVGGPGVMALLTYWRTPGGGPLAWALIGGGALVVCRWLCRLAGAEQIWRETAVRTRTAAIPESRAVFGRRGLT